MPAGRPKGSSGTNKSAAIREYLQNHPTASTNEVMEALGSRGIDVSQALVAGVRARDARGPGNKSRKRGEITVAELNSVNSLVEKFEDSSIIMGVIEDITSLVDDMGSFDRFKQAIEAYKNIKPVSASETDSEIDDDLDTDDENTDEETFDEADDDEDDDD